MKLFSDEQRRRLKSKEDASARIFQLRGVLGSLYNDKKQLTDALKPIIEKMERIDQREKQISEEISALEKQVHIS